MTIRLFATDMDGTLLTDADKSFDTVLFEHILTRLTDAGAYFVVATGNQYPKSLQYMDGFTDRGIYFIAENGAYIADGTQDLKVSSFDSATVRQIINVLEEFPEIGVIFSTHQGAYIHESRAETFTAIVREHLDHMGMQTPAEVNYLDFMRRFYPGTQNIDNYDALEEKDVVKVALVTHKRDTESIVGRLLEKLPEHIVPVQSGFGAIDLISRDVNKGNALAWLGEKLGVKPEEMMAFGDAANDLEMLGYAGVGVAMGNAVPAVKEAADVIIGENKDGAVLTYIQEILNHQQA